MELTIEHVTKTFGRKTAVNDLCAALTEGVYGILGANGSGKTTLMRILATVLRPSSGAAFLDGEDLFQMDERYRNLLGYLPQQVGYYKNFTAEKFLLYMAFLKGLPNAVAKKKVEETLEWVDLREYRNERIGSFSGGMKQRVGIAQALLNDPKILILDEPTAGLDPKERIRFHNLISATAKDRIILLSTHIVSDLDYIATEVIIMKQGRFIQKGTPSQLMQKIEGKVWKLECTDEELPRFQKQYKVSTITRKDETLAIRIIADEQPALPAEPVAANLEDLYLYYFSDSNENKRIKLFR